VHSKYRAFKMPCIYVYFFDNKPIYVGQTQRQFPDRDRQHLTGRTMFDKHYRHNKTRYTHRTLFEGENVTCNSLDRREIASITHFNTYINGLNGTPGGRMTKEMALGFYIEKCRIWHNIIYSILLD
jgi:hypothetical protein